MEFVLQILGSWEWKNEEKTFVGIDGPRIRPRKPLQRAQPFRLQSTRNKRDADEAERAEMRLLRSVNSLLAGCPTCIQQLRQGQVALPPPPTPPPARLLRKESTRIANLTGRTQGQVLVKLHSRLHWALPLSLFLNYCCVVLTESGSYNLRGLWKQLAVQFDFSVYAVYIASIYSKLEKSNPCHRLWLPKGLWDVEAPTVSRQSPHRWRRSSQPNAPTDRPLPPGWFLELISARRSFDPRATVKLEVLGKLQHSITTSGIEPAISRSLNQLRYLKLN
jgi:hypothetical protein